MTRNKEKNDLKQRQKHKKYEQKTRKIEQTRNREEHNVDRKNSIKVIRR